MKRSPQEQTSSDAEADAQELPMEGDGEQVCDKQTDQSQPLTPQEEIESLKAELEEANNRVLRVSADYQNFVRRSQQNLIDARQQQIMEIAKALVTVADHFDRALEADPDQPSGESFIEGVKIVRDELLRTLERFGVQRLEVKAGEVFDPNRHEALMRQPQDDVETNHIVAQLQPGYLLGDKTLRAAQVSVAE